MRLLHTLALGIASIAYVACCVILVFVLAAVSCLGGCTLSHADTPLTRGDGCLATGEAWCGAASACFDVHEICVSSWVAHCCEESGACDEELDWAEGAIEQCEHDVDAYECRDFQVNDSPDTCRLFHSGGR